MEDRRQNTLPRLAGSTDVQGGDDDQRRNSSPIWSHAPPLLPRYTPSFHDTPRTFSPSDLPACHRKTYFIHRADKTDKVLPINRSSARRERRSGRTRPTFPGRPFPPRPSSSRASSFSSCRPPLPPRSYRSARLSPPTIWWETRNQNATWTSRSSIPWLNR